MQKIQIYDIALCGAGIGGLTAAIALARQGLQVILVERMGTVTSHGSGLQIGPNACHVLHDLGMLLDLKKIATKPERIQLRDLGTAKTITHIPLGDTVLKKYGAPYYLVHRHDLHTLLLREALKTPGIDFVEDWPADHFIPHGDCVDLVSTRGQTYHARALIGCDGLWSMVRSELHGNDLPISSGQIAWRTLIPMSRLGKTWHRQQTSLFFGEDQHLVTYPVKGNEYLNFVAVTKGTAPGTGWSEQADKSDLHAQFRTSHQVIHELIDAMPDLHVWMLHDRDPLPQWGRGRVSLLGDAAHPNLPHLAQGAAMAIEDAHVLATCVSQQKNDLPTALRKYEALRQKRTNQVQRASRAQRKNYQMAATGGIVRNLALNMVGRFMPEKLLEHYDWLYAVNVVRDPSGSEG